MQSNRSLECKIRAIKETLTKCNMSEATIEENGAPPCLPFPSILKMNNGTPAKEAEARR
jgi:hypothetical protein